MNQFLSTQSGQGLLKDSYPDSSRNDEAMAALQRRQKMMQDRIQTQMPNPEIGQVATASFPVVPKEGPGRVTPISKSNPMRKT